MTLNNIAWRFNKDRSTDAEAFTQKVSAYQRAIYKDATRWQPEDIVFHFPELQIQYMAWVAGPEDLLDNETLIEEDQDAFDTEPEDGLYQVEINAWVKADNGTDFTALEFLLKAHNQMANKELGDHVFFEGTDENPAAADGVPTCYIACGS